MLRITEYYDGIVVFYCDKCKDYGVYSIANKITDDCVFKAEPSCQCGNKGELYFLHCKTEYMAKELAAGLAVLKHSDGRN